MEICGRYDGAIIGADSRQIYKRLDIGTAKPTREDMKKIPHYMVDIVEITEDFTAVDFGERATEHVGEIIRSGKLPLVVGGAGLYLEAPGLGDEAPISGGADGWNCGCSAKKRKNSRRTGKKDR